MTEKERLCRTERYTWEDLREIVEILRSEEGCPWDREQTHESLISCLHEEAQEVADAIEAKDTDNLCEELGDLLFQVVIHSRIAEEAGAFSVSDVVDGISRKMVRRHPHVFAGLKVSSDEEREALWERIKSEEKTKKP